MVEIGIYMYMMYVLYLFSISTYIFINYKLTGLFNLNLLEIIKRWLSNTKFRIQ